MSRTSFRLRQALDALVYGLAVTCLFSLIGAAVLLPLGRSIEDVELLLFILGMVTLAYATYQLLPEKPWGVEQTESGLRVTRTDTAVVAGSREETAFQTLVQRIPPLPRYGLPVDDRPSPGVKLFVAALCLFGTSLLIEMVFVW